MWGSPRWYRLSFEGMNESWRAAEAWNWERPGEAIGEDGQSSRRSPRTDGPGLMEKLRLSTMKKVPELLVKVQPSCSRILQHLEMVVPRDNCPSRTAAAAKRNLPKLRRQTVGAAESRARKVTRALWRSSENCEWISDPEHWAIYSGNLVLLWLWLCPDSFLLR